MLVSCNTDVVGSSTMENDKVVDMLVAPSAGNAKQELYSVSEESDVLYATPIRTSKTTTPNPAAAGIWLELQIKTRSSMPMILRFIQGINILQAVLRTTSTKSRTE
ncbi:hypothetical protein CTI12_AA446400 [Artemisia annua]|uniref:Uncharacterized protein n=1 Tax=Artemisia annua TaxID=35608 RepID=A0A2U1LUW2_ARTAN|nr:hypothetical protein CTI12_AA446400 [Artemisia annua]